MGFEPKTFGNALSGGFRNGVFGALPSGTVETLIVAVNAGRTTLGDIAGWTDDSAYASGGSTQSGIGLTVDDSQLLAPTTTEVWNFDRYDNHSYTFTGLTVGGLYRVEVLTTENFYTSAGNRLMTVALNGATKVTNFDAWAAVGAQLIASDALEGVGEVNADGSGEITVTITTGTGGQVFGVRVYSIT